MNSLSNKIIWTQTLNKINANQTKINKIYNEKANKIVSLNHI